MNNLVQNKIFDALKSIVLDCEDRPAQEIALGALLLLNTSSNAYVKVDTYDISVNQSELDPIIVKAQRFGILSVIELLDSELDEYEMRKKNENI